MQRHRVHRPVGHDRLIRKHSRIELPQAAPTQAAVEEFLLGAIASICKFERSEISPATCLADVGLDSLNATALAVHVEAEYGCEVSPDEFVEMLQAVHARDLVQQIHGIVRRHTLAH